ncbi:MAG TPA: fused MFS/spermidine synthase [Anaerolineae bacterium]|nr:fused MFS/spermidine synthase [Anaerolineae bacterium]
MESKRYLLFTVFVAGMSTLAIEFTASRMLQTVYGTSNIVWANVIGLVLFFLTLGYFIGGWWSDKRPFHADFYALVTAAGMSSILFLLLMSMLLREAALAMAAVAVGSIASSLVGVVLMIAVPITLLGCVSPFAVRLAVNDVNEAGRISGQIYAISTWGSLAGTYLPVLLVIPEAGTRWTAVIFGGILLTVGLIGLVRTQLPLAVMVLIGLLPLGLVVEHVVSQPIKQYRGQIYEMESAYNYIQVVRENDCNYLLLNEGQAFHSFYCDGGRVPVISVWSIMLAAPYFNEPAAVAAKGDDLVEDLAVIGLAAGSIPKQFMVHYEGVKVDGIELDPGIVEVGREYFEMTEPDLNVIVGDGRYALNQLDKRYDVITLDAYKVPYIPWHLTTQEFFEEVAAHLKDDGVLAINVGRVPNDRRLVEAVTATLQRVFPTVHTIDVPGALNSILVATMVETEPEWLMTNKQNVAGEVPPLLAQVLELATANLVPTVAGEVVFTDERAPVETMIDSLVIRYLIEEGPSALPSYE